MESINQIISQLIEFRDERDWKQFHNPKDLAIALNIESSELLELFLWKTPEVVDKEKVKEELADIFSYGLLLLNHYDLNIGEIMNEKLAKNATRYPVAKAKGKSDKYDQL